MSANCMELFLDKPVVIQLKNPIIAAISAEEVVVGSEKCGSAKMAFMEEPGKPNAPVMQQVLRGCVDDYDDKMFIFATHGGDGQTPVRVLIEVSNLASMTFCVEHVPLPVKPSIVMPGN